jgi:hypothetical protein
MRNLAAMLAAVAVASGLFVAAYLATVGSAVGA